MTKKSAIRGKRLKRGLDVYSQLSGIRLRVWHDPSELGEVRMKITGIDMSSSEHPLETTRFWQSASNCVLFEFAPPNTASSFPPKGRNNQRQPSAASRRGKKGGA